MDVLIHSSNYLQFTFMYHSTMCFFASLLAGPFAPIPPLYFKELLKIVTPVIAQNKGANARNRYQLLGAVAYFVWDVYDVTTAETGYKFTNNSHKNLVKSTFFFKVPTPHPLFKICYIILHQCDLEPQRENACGLGLHN